MPDIDDQLRELLRRKAHEVPPHSEVPAPMVSRAHRRIALNAMGVGLGIVLVASGAFAGVRTLGGPSVHRPAGSTTPPTTSSVQPTPSARTAPPCTSAQLQAVASLEGAAGSREGEIVVTNRSSDQCALEGTPAITLLDPNLDPIVAGITFGSSPPGWVANGSAKPAGWPVVTLRSGGPASFRVRWSNWCVGGVEPVWRIEVSGGGTVDVDGLDATMVPPCNGPGRSTIEVGPFEPRAGP